MTGMSAPQEIQWSAVWDAHDAEREARKGRGGCWNDLQRLLLAAFALVHADMRKEPDRAP